MTIYQSVRLKLRISLHETRIYFAYKLMFAAYKFYLSHFNDKEKLKYARNIGTTEGCLKSLHRKLTTEII